MAQAKPSPDESLDAIESSVLPSLSGMLDGLLDSAALARPGADADAYATELRYAAGQLDALARLLGAVAPLAQPAAAPRRMSA